MNIVTNRQEEEIEKVLAFFSSHFPFPISRDLSHWMKQAR